MNEELVQSVKTSPTISVIIPVYNAEKYLRRCIDSVLAQTYKDFELLLIDDGSKDSSGAICDEYAAQDARVRVFHKENGGVSSARNVGLDHAQGEWITFVDSDDYIEENFLKSFEGNLDADLVVGNMVICEDCKLPKNINVGILPGIYTHIQSALKGNLNSSAFYAPWGKMFRKESIADLRFNIKMRIGEDNHFNLLFLSQCKDLHLLSNSTGSDRTQYVYFVGPIICDAKYQMSVSLSIFHLLELETAYQKLGISDKAYEIYNAQAFYERCINDLPEHGDLWYKNKEVERLCLRRSAHLGIIPWVRTWLSFHMFYRLKMYLSKWHAYR